MRLLAKVLCFTAVAATTLVAKADTLDYTLTIGTLHSQTYTWSLASNPTPFDPNIFGFDVLNVDIAVAHNGTPIDSSVIFLTDQIHGGLAISNADFSFIISNGPQLFSATTGSPTMLTGLFSLEELGPGLSATLDVVDADTPAVPEPSSLALFGTGAMMGLAALRRRFSTN
jgi:PEP-CTERM motif